MKKRGLIVIIFIFLVLQYGSAKKKRKNKKVYKSKSFFETLYDAAEKFFTTLK